MLDPAKLQEIADSFPGDTMILSKEAFGFVLAELALGNAARRTLRNPGLFAREGLGG